MSYFNHVILLNPLLSNDLISHEVTEDLVALSYLAAAIENEVENVSIPVDFYGDNPLGDFERILMTQPVDLVAIGSMTGAFNLANNLARMAKRYDKYVVFGGNHPTALPEDVLKSPYVDAVILGEGELTLKDLVIKGPSKEVTGLVFKQNGHIVSTGLRPVVDNLDSLPFPLRRVRPVRFGEPGHDYSIDTIYSSRGCPHKCTFCSNRMVHKQWRARSPENVLQELAQLHDFRRKKVIKIFDACFFTDIHRVEKICDLMIENRITNFKIWIEARVDDIIRSEHILHKLYKVGVRTVTCGFESPNPETLKALKKGISIESCKRAVSLLKKNWIRPQGFFALGHYLETAEDTQKYPEYAQSLGLHYAVFMVITPYPGTAIFEDYRNENRIKSFDWDLYNNFVPVIETRTMDEKALKEGYAYCFGKFYLNKVFVSEWKSFILIMFKFIGYLSFFSLVEKTDKRSTPESIKNFIYAAVRSLLGKDIVSVQKGRIPLLLKLFKSITLRVKHSPGKILEIVFSHKGRTKTVHVNETDDRHSVRGLTVDLAKVLVFEEKISLKRAAKIRTRLYIEKIHPHSGLRIIRVILKNPSIIRDFFSIVWLMNKYVTGLLASLLLHPFRLKSNSRNV
jgi:anaerobic magnesium-protoporphyrin IX monomethyl ester cyclase